VNESRRTERSPKLRRRRIDVHERYQLVETDPPEDDRASRRRQCAELETLAAKLRTEGTPDLERLAASLREIAHRREARLGDGSAPVPANGKI